MSMDRQRFVHKAQKSLPQFLRQQVMGTNIFS